MKGTDTGGMTADVEFMEYFRSLKQVFLYVIDECNLRCRHCLYKPHLADAQGMREIPLHVAVKLIRLFRQIGASKLTIMGGEPMLYGAPEGNRPLYALISAAKNIGYEYVRIDTNGVFDRHMLMEPGLRELDEITFSLDGPMPEVNDAVRGIGTFERCVSNIHEAVALGHNVDITACIHRGFVQNGSDGTALLDELVRYASSLGVRRLNLHPVFKMGLPRDTWTEDTDISPEQWLAIEGALVRNIQEGRYAIPVRIPRRFTLREEFDRNRQYYGYCSAKLGERVLVHPNGIIRVCALLIGTPYGVARYTDKLIEWDKGLTNELRRHHLDELTPCGNQQCGTNGLVPLCISFKPRQHEFIWNEKLKWEDRGLAGAGAAPRDDSA